LPVSFCLGMSKSFITTSHTLPRPRHPKPRPNRLHSQSRRVQCALLLFNLQPSSLPPI
jgi:hypothetical protein